MSGPNAEGKLRSDNQRLPTPDEMLDRAENEIELAVARLGDALDWLRSDWRPVGSELTKEQARRRVALRRVAVDGRKAINRIRSEEELT